MNIITKLITRSILNLHLVDSLSKCFKESDSQGLNLGRLIRLLANK